MSTVSTGSATAWQRPWQTSDGWEALACYASELSLPAEFRGAASAEAAFSMMCVPRWAYVTEPWNPGQGQLVRDPDEVRANGAGTCLDLAAFFAAMMLSAGLYPRLAILQPEPGADDSHAALHACVLLSPNAGRHAYSVWHREDFGAADDFEVVDVVQAFVGQKRSWPGALASGRALFSQDSGYSVCHIINVRAAQGGGYLPAPPLPPDIRMRPGIYQMLPPPHHITAQPWQSDVTRKTREVLPTGGYVVVAGASGTGKSAASLPAAFQAAHGSGWMLPSADAEALSASYATAVAKGRPSLGEQAQAATALALERLATSVAPWVVIIDGADHPGGPDHYASLLPRPKPGQVAIITTTHMPQWRAWAELHNAPLIEVDKDAPLPLLDRLGGAQTDTVEELVDRRLAGWHTQQVDFARTVAWLPPIPNARPVAWSDNDYAEMALCLTQAGFVDRSSRLMHNLVRDAIRGAHGPEPELLAAFVRAYPMRFAATNEHDRAQLVNSLGTDPRSRAALLALADACTRDHDAWAARLYTAELVRLGCMIEDSSGTPVLDPDWEATQATTAATARRCLEGVARYFFRDKRVPYARAAEVVAAGLAMSAVAPDRALDQRLRALELNARRTSISADKALTAQQRAQRRLALLDELQAVLDWRSINLPEDDPDIFRARFNLAGPKIRLGQDAWEGVETGRSSAEWFMDAFEDYRSVYEWRRRYYATESCEDVATCLNGQGTALYYTAIADQSAQLGTCFQELGRAADFVVRAMNGRLRVAGLTASGTSSEVRGSAALLTKIALAQAEIGRPAAQAWVAGAKATDSAMKELHDFKDVPMPEAREEH